MKTIEMVLRRALLPVTLALLAACSGTTNTPLAAEAPKPPPFVSPLAGSAWQLVQIQSMDDSVAAPADRAGYTLTFHKDGKASMRADCNRGTGTWHSEASGQLTFGPVAATRALCPPQSLSEEYLKQFQWVRSYVIENGHLFLATMADGSIIEFEPIAPEEQEAVAAIATPVPPAATTVP